MTSNYLSTPSGNEAPFSSLNTSTTVNLVTAGNNGARVTLLRCAEINGVSSTTLQVEVVPAAATTATQIRSSSALGVREVWKEYDIRLLRGEVLRAVTSISSGAHFSGLVVIPPKGPGS